MLWVLLIFGRLFYLQVFRHEELARIANSQQERTFDIRAPRGTIYDRNGAQLAVSLPAESLAVNRRKLKDPSIAFDLLHRILGADTARLYHDLERAREKGRDLFWVKRKLTDEEAASLRALKQDWMEFTMESRRVYPHGTLGAAILGSVNLDDRGNAGIEQSQERLLGGKPGKLLLLTDVKRRGIETLKVIEEPRPGANITLTVDAGLQEQCDRIIEAAVRGRCESGTAVVMHPETGDILAMSAYPSFNPNDPIRSEKDLLARQHAAVTQARDPGSVQKLFTLAALLENTKWDAKTVIHCGNGKFRFGKTEEIEDNHSYGYLPVEHVIWKSSNVGAIQMGIHTGREALYRTLVDFGFGDRTGVPLPGESRGILWPLSEWKKSSLYYISMGHELTVTTVQLARAAAAFANGGFLVTPRLVLATQAEGGELEYAPAAARRRIIKAATAAEVRRISEGVIHFGTGKLAKLDGFTAGGKTGTAQLLEAAPAQPGKNGKKRKARYGHRYAASFMGYAPLQNPQVVVVVTLNGATRMASDVAAPVFKQIAEKALRALAVERDVPEHRAIPEGTAPGEDEGPALVPAPRPLPRLAHLPGAASPAVREIPVGRRAPDFHGKAKADVLAESARLGIPVEMVGAGLARSQDPPPGSLLLRGETVRVQFVR